MEASKRRLPCNDAVLLLWGSRMTVGEVLLSSEALLETDAFT